LADEPKIPKIVGDKSATQSLRLSATEGFILSRIDGKVSHAELGALTGLPESAVRAALEKLESLKVIEYVSRPPPAPPVAKAPGANASSQSGGPAASGDGAAPRPADAGADGPPVEAPHIAKRVLAAMARVSRDSPELREDVDLDPELRLRVLGASAVLESLDLYEMLAVERTADKKTVKRAYFEIAALFHPDRYFRKRLGSYKLRMETLFGRATQALDTLSSKELRAEYDLYLEDLDRTRAIEDLMRDAAAEAQRAEEDAVRSAGRASLPEITPEINGVPVPTVTAAVPAGQPAAKISGFYPAPRTPAPPSRPSGAPSATPSQRPPGSVSDQARRDALAMRLLGNRSLSSRGMGAVTSGSSPAPAVRNVDGGDALKRRYEDRIQLARKAQAAKYIGLAADAEAKKDVVGAATAYKVALSFLSEGDPNLLVAKAAIQKAEEALSETYLRQATYEDRAEHWQDAARSWQRVIRGRPADARAHERAAHALARSKGDLHIAAQLAQRAVQLEPENPEYKITLALVFIEAGLLLNARRELEAAAQLSPRNANIQALLKRVHKAG
jgi:curved DNA-binding protein CbpA